MEYGHHSAGVSVVLTAVGLWRNWRLLSAACDSEDVSVVLAAVGLETQEVVVCCLSQ